MNERSVSQPLFLYHQTTESCKVFSPTCHSLQYICCISIYVQWPFGEPQTIVICHLFNVPQTPIFSPLWVVFLSSFRKYKLMNIKSNAMVNIQEICFIVIFIDYHNLQVSSGEDPLLCAMMVSKIPCQN